MGGVSWGKPTNDPQPLRAGHMAIWVEAIDCRSSSLNGLSGLVISMGKNTIVILTEGGSEKVIPVAECRYYVKVDGCTYLMDSRTLIKMLRRVLRPK